MNKIKQISTQLLLALTFVLVCFPALLVVTRGVGFNLPLILFVSGIGTLIFHLCTKNKLPMILSISGLYMGGIITVTQKYDKSFAQGGMIIAGIIYLIFALLSYKFKDKILKILPNWLLSISIVIVGFNLIQIGVGLISKNIIVGIVSVLTIFIFDLFASKKLSMFSMLFGILAGTITSIILNHGLDLTPLHQPLHIEFMSPKFNLESILMLSTISIASIFEMLSDTKNSGSIIGMNIFEEVGIHRVSLGNGLSTIFSSLIGGTSLTTFSEANNYMVVCKEYNPNIQILSSFILMILAFIPMFSKLILLIPLEATSGCIMYLFCIIVISGMKQIFESEVNLSTDKREFCIMTIMLAFSFIPFKIFGLSISNVAIAIVIGIILNLFIPTTINKQD
ncbi:putative uracil permease [Clostridium phage D-1873]|uniref:Uracil permease n=2 Tax=root TaxID=1 RepID=A0A9P2G5B4_CLOBO|nr:solute carrier family 23 protein [Clostridium botulinum]EES90270.1 putative uracil permease [Clostridium phage D-1873]QPW56560.1 uracil permease [Clostridium botulinum]BAE53584.1 putative uracil permease [Clostridium botulinum D phage]